MEFDRAGGNGLLCFGVRRRNAHLDGNGGVQGRTVMRMEQKRSVLVVRVVCSVLRNIPLDVPAVVEVAVVRVAEAA